MSRYDIPTSENDCVTIGWDPVLATYFLQMESREIWIGRAYQEILDVRRLETAFHYFLNEPLEPEYIGLLCCDPIFRPSAKACRNLPYHDDALGRLLWMRQQGLTWGLNSLR